MEEGPVFCHRHAAWAPRADFYATSIGPKKSCCKRCFNIRRAARIQRDPVARLQRRINKAECRREPAGAYVPITVVRDVYKRYRERSALDADAAEAAAEAEELCAVRFFPDMPLHTYPWNTVLLTLHESKQIPRGEDLRKRAKFFPKKLQAEMMEAQIKKF